MQRIRSEALDFRAASESFAPVCRLCRWNLKTPPLVGSGFLRDLGTGPQAPRRRYYWSE